MTDKESGVTKGSGAAPVVLVVDDREMIRKLIARRLKKRDYTLVIVESGQQALDAIAAQSIDLVLLDNQMSQMDGIMVIREIRKNSKNQMPVIMMTAHSSLDLAIEFLKNGGTDFIEKPIDFDALEIKMQMAIQSAQKLEREIAVRKKAEADREKLIEDLDAYAHTVAHNLKTPLNGVTGMSQLLLNDYTDMTQEEAQPILQDLLNSGIKMNSIIDELLLLARVQTEHIVMKPLDMTAIIADVRKRLALMIEPFEPVIQMPDNWPVAVGYAAWVEEIWANILSNALKYGGRPPVLELGADEGVNGMVRFWIHDNGRGLSTEEQSKLFTPFTRAHHGGQEGHGLGLSIIRRIAQKHGGEAGVESEGIDGGGCVFYFTLPRLKAAQ